MTSVGGVDCSKHRMLCAAEDGQGDWNRPKEVLGMAQHEIKIETQYRTPDDSIISINKPVLLRRWKQGDE